MNSTITDIEKTENLALSIVSREYEIEQYQVNINNYEIMLQSLPSGAWPESLLQYKDVSADKLLDVVPFDLVDDVSDYQFRDKVQKLLIGEKLEQKKSQRVYDALLSQLPEQGRQEILQAAKAAMRSNI